MNVLINKPTPNNIWTLIALWALIIMSALYFTGCKARKVERISSKEVDKSVKEVQVSKKDSSVTNAGSSTKTLEVIKDSSGYTRTTETEYYEPSATIPLGSPKKKTEKESGSALKQTDKTTGIDDFLNHSEIESLDSLDKQKNDIKKDDDSKKIEAKDNTLKIWVGIGIVLSVLVLIIIWQIKKRPG